VSNDPLLAVARSAVEAVEDPELVDVTIGDLGIVRDVRLEGSTVVVELTPTYTACPAFDVISEDVQTALRAAGFDHQVVRRRLSPPWTSDWMNDRGRRALLDGGIAPPAERAVGPIDLPTPTLRPRTQDSPCPQCGSPETEIVSWHGSSACKSLCRCRSCSETFESFKTVKEILA
jgi:ring-1,2-phenylacetyl-CoA epoxidase subunit PaaD